MEARFELESGHAISAFDARVEFCAQFAGDGTFAESLWAVSNSPEAALGLDLILTIRARHSDSPQTAWICWRRLHRQFYT